MLLLVDRIDQWEQIGAPALAGSTEVRTYYLAHRPYAALLLCRNGLKLGNLLGRVVDAGLGWDRGDPGFSRSPGTRQTKVTIYHAVQGRPEQRLSLVLRDAPRFRD